MTRWTMVAGAVAIPALLVAEHREARANPYAPYGTASATPAFAVLCVPVREPPGMACFGEPLVAAPINAVPGRGAIGGTPSAEPIGGTPGSVPIGGTLGPAPIGGTLGSAPTGGTPSAEPIGGTLR
jgi:hypothetical protein